MKSDDIKTDTDKACLEIAGEKERQECGGESRGFKYRDW